MLEFAEKINQYKGIIEKAKSIIVVKLPDKVKEFEDDLIKLEEQKLLTVAFIGQYSSGKSTIISALTGNKNIKIDSDIATDKCTEYIWNDNILLIDTPGIFTDRKDHDEITYKQIKKSDLLIFTITSDLFDDIILSNFNKIAFDEKQYTKIMLVVNKMLNETGEFDTLVKNYTETLKDDISSLNNFRSSFVDAALYIEGKNDNDKDLIDISHFDSLVENINIFIRENGNWAQFSTPIYKSRDFIQSSIENLTINEDEVKEYINVLKRIQKEVLNTKNRIVNNCKSIINSTCSDIIALSDSIMRDIGLENVSAEKKNIELQNNIDELANLVQQGISKIINESEEELNETVKDIMESDRADYVIESIELNKLNVPDTSIKDFSEILNKFNFVSDKASKVGVFLSHITNANSFQGFAKASQVAGSDGAKIIYTIGKTFGFKFKPWGAVNIAKTVGNVSKFIGPVLSLLSVGLEIADTVKENENNKKIAQAKNEFYEMTDKLRKEINEQVNTYIHDSLDSILNTIQDARSKVTSNKTNNDENIKKLCEYDKELENMLELIIK